MTTYIHDLIDNAELFRMMEEGRINKQVHKDLPISIYNYSAKAQYIGEWSKSERVCRGLIVEDNTGRVIARGPEKFFNYGQTGAPEVPLDSPVLITKKEDGSLGIGWTYDGHYGVATRGSFTSEQAIHASKHLTDLNKQSLDWNLAHNFTRIWEIIYPANRIVLDYGDMDRLLELGTVDNKSGLITNRYRDQIKGRWWMPFSEAISFPIPADEEGYVLDIYDKNSFDEFGHGKVIGHVKLKGNEYKILHGLLTNTNARRIWVELAARDCHQWIETPEDWANKLGHNPADFFYVKVDKDITETLLTNVPDEFYTWVTKQIDSINDKVVDLIAQSLQLAGRASMVADKRERFELVKGHPMTKEILNHADSTNREDISKIVLKAWKLAKPAGNETPFRTQEED
jgi:RNA ligase